MFLEGIQVVDFTTLLPGPYATLRLAELGASVIKVEPEQGGDPARTVGPQWHEQGVVFLANNRGKRSLTLDLKSEAGKAMALEMALNADVVIEGFRPGVASRLGIGYEDVRMGNPGVVYCSLTGYGQTGPYRDAAGHDLNYLSASGVLSLLKDRCGQPIVPAVQLADHVGGIVAVEAILAALLSRHATGKGAYLDVSMTDAMMGLLTTHTAMHALLGEDNGISELAGHIVCYNLYKTQDDRTVSLCALEPKFWRNFCVAVGKPEWYGQAYAKVTSDDKTYEEVKTVFRQYTSSRWQALADEHDFCLQVVLSVPEALQSQHARERSLVRTLLGPEEDVRYVDTHVGGNGMERPTSTWPPEIGKNGSISDMNGANQKEI